MATEPKRYSSKTQSIEEQPLNRVFDILSHPHRRQILVTLAGSSPRQEAVVTFDELCDESRNSATQLYHVHLPRLEEAGFVTWEPEKRLVRRGPGFRSIQPLLELLNNNPEKLPGDWIENTP